MPQTKPSSLRLNDTDKANARTIMESGAAQDITGAVRVALALVAKRLIGGLKR